MKVLCWFGIHDWYIIEDYLISYFGTNINIKECGRCRKWELD